METNISELRSRFEAIANEEKAIAMKAYMKGLSLFFGIKSPERREISKDIINDLKQESGVNWGFIFDCFEQEEREFQYIATDYLRKVQKRLVIEDLDCLRSLILNKSWWDTVDALAMEVGSIFYQHSSDIELLTPWITDDNKWIRRVAIIHQLKFKSKTDTSFLTQAIELNLGSKEFFINKAIGWALRSYADTNPKWVLDFVETNDLAPLSRREALRKIT